MHPDLYDHTAYAWNALALQTAGVAAGIAALGIFALVRARVSPVGLAFFVLCCSIGWWLGAYSAMYAAPDERTALWWAKAGQVGIAFIPAAVYHFNALLIEDYDRVRIKVILTWGLSALFGILMAATNIHFDSLYRYSWGYYPRLRPGSILFLLYFFAVMLIALKRYVAGYRRAVKFSRQLQRTKMQVVAFSIGYLGALDFIPSFGIPWYPPGYVPIFLYILLSAGTILRYRFTTITPALAAGRIIETMKDGLVVTDAEGIIRMVNQAACSLFGVREQDLVGSRPARSLPHNPALAEKLAVIMSGGGFGACELEHPGPDAAPRTLSLSASIIRNSMGEPFAGLCTITDVTGRKRADREREELIARLKKANEQLQAIDKIKSEIVSIVAHELRTPLTTIRAFAELILMKPHMPEQQRGKLMETVNNEAKRLTRLISDHLDLARIESGLMQWRAEAVAIEDVVRTSIAGTKPLVESKQISLSADFGPGLPVVRGDRDRLIQVVTNILSNAVKFTPEGGAIRIAARRQTAPDDAVLVEISDSGIGIPTADLEHIFEKFARSGQVAGTIEGTGLGLAIARQIIQHHNGRLWAASEPGKGSTFTFAIPVSDESARDFTMKT